MNAYPKDEPERPMVVTYEETELHLTRYEYAALQRAVWEDPSTAETLALGFLRREGTTS